MPDQWMKDAADRITRLVFECPRNDMSRNPDCEYCGECRDGVDTYAAIVAAVKDRRISELEREVAELRESSRLAVRECVQEAERKFQEHHQRVQERIEQGCRQTKDNICRDKDDKETR